MRINKKSALSSLLRLDPLAKRCIGLLGSVEKGMTKERTSRLSRAFEDANPAPSTIDWSHDTYMLPSSVDLSVIVPAYNVEPYIGECLRSLLKQDCAYSYEIIIVNDGSTDGTRCEILRFVDDQRLHLIDQPNGGISAARNVGISLARGRSIMFVDSDDYVEPGYLGQMVEALDLSGADYVTSGFARVNANGNTIGLGEAGDYGTAWGRVYKRSVWEAIRFPVGYWYEDTVIAFFIDGFYNEAVISSHGYCYRCRETSISHSDQGNAKSLDTFWITKELFALYVRRGLPIDERLQNNLLIQLGPLLAWRTRGLSAEVRKGVFAASCELYEDVLSNLNLLGSFGSLGMVEKALINRKWLLWNASSFLKAAKGLVGNS